MENKALKLEPVVNLREMYNRVKEAEVGIKTMLLYLHDNVFKPNMDMDKSPYLLIDRECEVREKQRMQIRGHELAMFKRKAMPLMERQVTDKEGLNTLYQYIRRVYDYLPSRTGREIEVNFYEARAKFGDDTPLAERWLKVPFEKLLPDDIEGDSWARGSFLDMVDKLHHLHFLHISVEDPTQVAYYPSIKHRREGREVRTKLGRYLTTYAEIYNLTEAQIKTMVEKHNARQAAAKNWQVRFIESNDPDGWVRIYSSRDVASCMRGNEAVQVYAHDRSTLRLAYLATVSPKTDEVINVLARCIVREGDEDERGWLRTYPDHNGHAEGRFLLDYLTANGYPKRIGLDGVLLQAIPEDGGYMCPYIDYGSGGAQSVDITTRDGKEYLIVTENGTYDATSTDGVAYTANCSCDECGDRYDEGDMNYVECTGYNYCRHCYDELFVYGYDGTYQTDIPRDEAIYVAGEYYHESCLEQHDIYYCEISGDYYHIEKLCRTSVGYVHFSYCTELDYKHQDEYEYAVTDEIKDLPDGKVCHQDDYDSLIDEYYTEDDDEGQTDNVSECPQV